MDLRKISWHRILRVSKRQSRGTQRKQKKRALYKKSRLPIYRNFMYGVALSIVLIFFKWSLEHWEFGKQIEQMTYSMLQIRLLSRSALESLPVAIVDISGLAPVPVEYAGKTELITPRDSLLSIIKSIVVQKPRAIGIDLNFSPGAYGYISPADPVLLEFLLNVRRRGIPVYVGIYDSVVLDPGRWLGQPGFRPLAAYITVPNPEHTEPSTRMVEWVQPAGVSEPCFSLSYALAKTDHRSIPRLLRWAVKRAAVTNEEEFSASEFLVDYGPLETLLAERIIADNDKKIVDHRPQIKNRIVLVGRASPGQSTDQFNVPGRGMPVPGIYVHAAATYTLLKAPLYRLTSKGRIAADGLAALLVFGPILLIQLYYRRRSPSETAGHRLQFILTASVILAVLVVGHFLVHKIRLIWTDYLMVIGALLFHSPTERFLGRSLEWFRIALPTGWPRAIFKKARGKKGS